MTATPVTVTMDRAGGEVDRSLERGHILALDGLRGIAILLVVFSHFVSNLRLTANGIAYVPIALAHAGWAGVGGFIVAQESQKNLDRWSDCLHRASYRRDTQRGDRPRDISASLHARRYSLCGRLVGDRVPPRWSVTICRCGARGIRCRGSGL